MQRRKKPTSTREARTTSIDLSHASCFLSTGARVFCLFISGFPHVSAEKKAGWLIRQKLRVPRRFGRHAKTCFIMTRTNKTAVSPPFWRHTRHVLCWPVRSALFRFLMALIITLFSIFGKQFSKVIVHAHEFPHVASAHDPHAASDDDHDHDHEELPGEDHDESSSEHHHHSVFSDGTTLFSVHPSPSLFLLHEVRLSPESLADVCPDGPVFDLVKPPQVT